ncbi:proton-conducting transporter transmembrane domain-containing protein [Methanothermococcus okinawensis]|uniref:NADH dehydrogenase (Quinone) n=1 Tax=Methanothermococcus okinawensis (strain DSM 14208 / JCM 11175 / IH1) TaxID=647113 RepID=F8AKC9_METOI|nr:proton-conducting transporter membrane subunit [Methanothermococcus okinawensis]AEH06329.1 NADH dehydrogenase (quinone) [Methanothermococcus okinawensis IH1]
MDELVVIIPALAGIVAYFIKGKFTRYIPFLAAIVQVIITAYICIEPSQTIMLKDYIFITPLGKIVLGITSLLFLMVSYYSIDYLKNSHYESENIYSSMLLFFVSAMSLAAISDHIILTWIAIEATTISSAPLIFLHKSRESIVATWKYLITCSVGISLALLGSFITLQSISQPEQLSGLLFSNIMAYTGTINPLWFLLGFVFILIGYGTKVGLAPMHIWLSDAHGEAPSPASALLSGALLNCAFLPIYKFNVLAGHFGLENITNHMLMALGLFSVFIAAAFMPAQKDYKRLLAYSSIENMGIIALGTGIGGIALLGSIFHMINHSLIKCALFLATGNMLIKYGTKDISKVTNFFKLLPKTAFAFTLGAIGIMGFPPLGLFLSELLIIFGAFANHYYLIGFLFITGLILVIAGFSKKIIQMCYNTSNPINQLNPVKESFGLYAPSLTLLIISLVITALMFSPYQDILLNFLLH